MDQIDQWISRAFEQSSNQKPAASQGNKPAFPKPPHPKNKSQFQKSGFGQKPNNGSQGQSQKPSRPIQSRPQKPAGRPPSPKPPQKSFISSGKNRFRNNKAKRITGPKKQIQKPTQIIKGKLKIIPLGGLNEVGKNMTVIEYENDIIVLDMGLEFPSEDLLGIDYVIPDITYLEQNKKRIKGIFITHGHLDHIGGIPYILPKLDFPPVYGTRLTLGLISKRGDEFKHDKLMQLRVMNPGESVKMGQIIVRFIRVTHSIPDSVAILVETPAGKIVDTGDFKFDDTPARPEDKADIPALEALGKQNILALFCESTNALKPGHSMSEKEVGETLEKLVRETPGRLIIASFASQIGRMQQIVDAAEKNNRQIFVSGRSMLTNLEISAKLGYLKLKQGQIKDIRQYRNIPDKQTLILTTGSQGEAVSALSRIADNEHPHVKARKGDTIVLSSSPIIGNEKAISSIINKLAILGADVIHNQLMDVHTSGHGKQDELARMINYVKPQYLVPIHGEYYMRKGLGDLAKARFKLADERIIMIQNGDVLLGANGKMEKSNETVETKYILIDGSGEGTVGSNVQFDREIMSQNGVAVILLYINRKTGKPVKEPDVITRGFIYMHESEQITQEIIKIASAAYKTIVSKNIGANRKDIKRYIQQSVDRFTSNTLERRPLIVPLIIEV